MFWLAGYGRLLATFCFSLFLVATFAAGAEATGKRVAFVVGNGAYQAVPVLANPANDAKAVSEALRKVGFEVVTAIDLDHKTLEKSVETFIRSLANADISLFYYSGHGVEVNGENRLIPIDARLADETALEVETISLQTIMMHMRDKSRAQLLYLDACRDNPFAVKKFLVGADSVKRQVGRGLAPQKATIGSLIAYATEPGNIALDGDSENSPFTSAVLRHSFDANVDVQSALLDITRDVWEATNQKQRPWSNATLVEPVFLNPSDKKATPPAEPKRAAEPAPMKTASEPVTVAALPSVTGLGPQPVLDSANAQGLPEAASFRVTKMPEAGSVSVDGAVVAEGAELTAETIEKLRFEPAPTETAALMALALEATTSEGNVIPVVINQSIGADACDTEAAEPLDLQGTQKGVLPNEINVEQALAACRRAVEKHPDVARFVFQLGRAELAARNLDEANALFNRAAELGHVRAFNQMGYMAQRGIGQPQSVEEANIYFKQGAEKGDPYAMLSYGRNLARGRGLKTDVEKGIAYLTQAVELGHTYAMNELGSMYMNGDPVKKNPKRGVRFFEASMNRGDIYGIHNMGLAYLSGNGVEKDPEAALAMFLAASKGGHPFAPTDIGAMYFNGTGVKKDINEAIKWYEIGAERGNRAAASNLAWIYAEGPDDLRDVVKAITFTALAAALDTYKQDNSLRERLAGLPAEAKSDAVKTLIKTVGPENVVTANDLDETLVLLSRKAWQLRNPRVDLF